MIRAASAALASFAVLTACGRSAIVQSADAGQGAGSSGGWAAPRPTGSLARPRYFHTATLLPSGQVLIAGGYGASMGPDRYVARAELYDSETGTFRVVGSMVTARAQHTATLLPNGEVLIVGGLAADGTPANAEIYANEQFTSVGSMVSGRFWHQATLLGDGRVLVTGGFNNETDHALRSESELYDSATGEFTTTGTMLKPSYDHSATLLPDGKVLVTGGRDKQTYLARAELYDPARGAFVAAGNMEYQHWDFSATGLGSGKVLVVGGSGKDRGGLTYLYPGMAELFDAAKGTFEPTGPMRVPRTNHTATLLSDEEVFIAGGFAGDDSDVLPDTEIYDLARASFTAGPRMAVPRVTHTATRLSNGKVLIAGGQSGVALLSSAELR